MIEHPVKSPRGNDGSDPALAIHARGLRKTFGRLAALDGIDLSIPKGAICGLIGPNGAGKTTTLKSLVGLCDVRGELTVAGHDPRKSRAKLMEDACFIADVGVLPRALRARDVVDYIDAVHPKFDRLKALNFLASTDIDLNKKIRGLSKGMVTQLHLAVVMAIDVELLILDEPTLGLDILYRKEFYDRLLTQFYDGSQTILISTHQVEEIESLLTHLVFLKRGKVILNTDMDSLAARFVEVTVSAEHAAEAQALGPIAVRSSQGCDCYLYESRNNEPIDRTQLVGLGALTTPSVADLFVAKLGGSHA